MKKSFVWGLVCATTIGCSAESIDEHSSQGGEPGPIVHERTLGMDCSAFDTYTAALATFTVDCTGTIGPDSFFVDGDGFLARRFSACTNDRTKLQSIDSILSLQRRGERLPFAAECIAGRWAEWKVEFDRLGITQCPSWQKQASIGAPTAQRIDSLAVEFTRLPARKTETALPVMSDFREDNLYAVAFEAPAPSQGCATAGECATACAAGFNGFVLETHARTVLTDPAYWLLDATYATASIDPFLRPGYYHPMSYSGPIPGAQFAHANRARPCPGCPPETCSYYAGSIHIKLPLWLDCLDPADSTTCVGVCSP